MKGPVRLVVVAQAYVGVSMAVRAAEAPLSVVGLDTGTAAAALPCCRPLRSSS